MKRLAIALVISFASSFVAARGGGGSVGVHGYVKSNGTYVQPHMRSAPDGNFNNNWSTSGNVNPYTGEAGKKVSPTGGIGSPIYLSPNDIGGAAPSYVEPSDPTLRPPTPPAHSRLNSYTGQIECDRGYRYSTNECVAVQLPANAKINVFGNDWECQRGYRRSGSECVAVQLPANAKINVFGNDWECQRGYRQSGGECVAVQLPANAKINVFGNDWECQRGYRQSGSECPPRQNSCRADRTSTMGGRR
jgi:hypothetical protein